MGTLAVTFQGPFVFSVGQDNITVYGPDCLDHVAVFSTVEAEAPILGQAGAMASYALSSPGITPIRGPVGYPLGDRPSDYIIDASNAGKVNLSLPKFSIQLPLPTYIYGISADEAEVVKTGAPTNKLQKWSTGLRFYYTYDLEQPVSFGSSGSPVSYSFSNIGTFTDYADITIQHVGPEADDPEHKDALACFGTIMTLLGLSWTLNYGNTGTFSPKSRPGGDCKSPVVMLR